MDVSYALEPFTDEVRDAYLKLLPEQEQAIASGKLDWKFSRNPAGAGMVAVARGDGEIIGINAFMPSRLGLRRQSVVAYQSMDTIVLPAAHGEGVFPGLLNCFYERTDGALIYGYPYMNSSPSFFSKLGWTSFGPMPMMFRPLRTGYYPLRFGCYLTAVRLPVLARPNRFAER